MIIIWNRHYKQKYALKLLDDFNGYTVVRKILSKCKNMCLRESYTDILQLAYSRSNKNFNENVLINTTT